MVSFKGDEEKSLWNGNHTENDDIPQIPAKKRAFWLILVLIILAPFNFIMLDSCKSHYKSTYNSLLNTKFGFASSQQPISLPGEGSNFEEEATEAFELQLPILYKNLVHEETIIDCTFGDSWGIPFFNVFETPDVEFNRIALVLNTTVDGVQYDRLAHIFIDDIPVWRTSTAEPGNKLVFSSSKKDISKYLPLFVKEKVGVTLKLDNLVRGKLTGAFHTILSIQYFNEEEKPKDLDDISSFFTVTSKPSQRVTQLIESPKNKSPLLYYPTDKPSFRIPVINANTTNLKLALYVSGNAAEEFWYSNVLDKNQDIFEGHSLLGHGPVRVVNVYLDGIRISSVAPDPVIFTGGISPALWRPIVGVNAFDIKPIEIDLTAVLPTLWEKHSHLEIEITNGDSTKHIGSNWIIAANLLHWESEEIESSFGKIEKYDNSSYYGSFSISTDVDNLYQNVLSNHTVDLYSNITYNLYNGTQVPLKLHTKSDARYSNYQQYSEFGDVEFVSTVISTSHSAKVYHNDKQLSELSINKVYPLVISIDTEPIQSRNLTYNANVTSLYASTILIDKKEVYVLESRYNGTSTFTLSPTGNYGFGSSTTNLAASLTYPFPELKYDQLAESVNGTVIRRDSATDYSVQNADLSNVNENHKAILDLMVKEKAINAETAKHFLADDAISMTNFNATISERKNAFGTESKSRNPWNLLSIGVLEG